MPSGRKRLSQGLPTCVSVPEKLGSPGLAGGGQGWVPLWVGRVGMGREGLPRAEQSYPGRSHVEATSPEPEARARVTLAAPARLWSLEKGCLCGERAWGCLPAPIRLPFCPTPSSPHPLPC